MQQAANPAGTSTSTLACWVRRSHRWVSIAFTLTVLANFVAMALRPGPPPPWITYAPLAPLAVLLFSGLYLFALPYLGRGRRQAAPRKAQTTPA